MMIGGGVIVALLIVGGLNRLVSKSATERAIESATNGQVEVDSNGDNVTVKTDQGTWSTSDKLPADFPTDVPLYPGAELQGSLASAPSDGSGGHYVGLESTDAIATVVAWYKKEIVAKGWKIITDANISGSTILSAEKDTRMLSVTISEESGKVSMSIVLVNQ